MVYLPRDFSLGTMLIFAQHHVWRIYPPCVFAWHSCRINPTYTGLCALHGVFAKGFFPWHNADLCTAPCRADLSAMCFCVAQLSDKSDLHWPLRPAWCICQGIFPLAQC